MNIKRVYFQLFLFSFIVNVIPIRSFSQSHVMKIQIQGREIKRKGSEIFFKWDEGIICTKSDGITLLDKAYNSCRSDQKDLIDDAWDKARDWIIKLPVNGIVSSSNSNIARFTNRTVNEGDARIDIELYRGAAFSNDRHIVYIKIVGSDLSSTKEWREDSKHIIAKDTALDELGDLWRSLSTEQKEKRDDAYKSAVDYIKSAPINGYMGKNLVKEFKDSDASSGELIRIIIDKGAAFCDK